MDGRILNVLLANSPNSPRTVSKWYKVVSKLAPVSFSTGSVLRNNKMFEIDS